MNLTKPLFSLINYLDKTNPWLLRVLPSRLKLKIVRAIYKPIVRLRQGTITVDGFTVRYPQSMDYCYALKEHEPEVKALLSQILKPGMTAIDIGANVGYHTLIMAKQIGSQACVYAVEASEDNLRWLQENLTRNHIENVKTMPYAAGEMSGERIFYVHADGGANNLYEATAKAHEVIVREVRLDDVITGKIDLIKIDIEGGEIAALHGMQRILQENPQIHLIVEWNPVALSKAGYAPEQLPRLLLEMGYKVTIIDDPQFTSIEQVLESQYLHSTKHWHANLYANRQN